MHAGFSTGQADPIHPALISLKSLKNVIERDRNESSWVKDQSMIVTVWAAEVTTR